MNLAKAILYQRYAEVSARNAREFAERGPSKRFVAAMFQREAAHFARVARKCLGVE